MWSGKLQGVSLVLAWLEVCSGGRGVVKCLPQVLLPCNKPGHGVTLDLMAFLCSGFVQQKELHPGQLVDFPGKLFGLGFESLGCL